MFGFTVGMLVPQCVTKVAPMVNTKWHHGAPFLSLPFVSFRSLPFPSLSFHFLPIPLLPFSFVRFPLLSFPFLPSPSIPFPSLSFPFIPFPSLSLRFLFCPSIHCPFLAFRFLSSRLLFGPPQIRRRNGRLCIPQCANELNELRNMERNKTRGNQVGSKNFLFRGHRKCIGCSRVRSVYSAAKKTSNLG